MKRIVLFVAVIYSTISLATPEKIVVTELSKDVFVLSAIDDGTNIGLLKTTKGIVFLDRMPRNESLDALNHLVKHLDGERIKFIFNTRDYDDHSDGNTQFY